MACIESTSAKFSAPGIEDKLDDAIEEKKNRTDMLKTQLDPIAGKLCAWAAPEYKKEGALADRWWWIAAQVTLMASYIALNTYLQNKQYDIAKSYASLAQDKWERFRDRYAPLEKKMLNEVSSVKEPSVDYSGAKSRATSSVNLAFNSINKAFTAQAKRYALCLDPTLSLDRAKALSLDDTVNFNYRDAENYANYLSDKRWNRRSDILNLGRNNTATAHSYAQNAYNAFSGVSAALQQAGNGLSGLIGYLSNRNEAVYPAQFSMATQYANAPLMAGGYPLS